MQAQLEVCTLSLNNHVLFAREKNTMTFVSLSSLLMITNCVTLFSLINIGCIYSNSHNFFLWGLLVYKSKSMDKKNVEVKLIESLSVCSLITL